MMTVPLAAPPQAPRPATRPRLLLVDDEPNIRAVLWRTLAGGGYDLLQAGSGEEALELFRRAGADVVLSDLMMPGMSGIDLLREVKAIDDTVAFIILTGAGSMENAIEALRLQADDYLLKPFNLDAVLFSVDRALEHRRLVRENRSYQQTLEQRVAEQAREIEKLFVEALFSLAGAIEARDGYTGGHVERVTRYAVATGVELGLDAEALRHLWVAALLHDVGKIAIPDEILRKPGRLTAEELEVMRRHPLTGAAIVERSDFLRPALPGILHHQERWDGNGYPSQLRGEEISLQGRILAVADTFDAIVTTRPYRRARTALEAIAELRRCAGTQFDPAVVEAFVRAYERGFPVDDCVPALHAPAMAV